MDGVPWLTQPPVEPAQSFTYRFMPPDAGTSFFHRHCDTVRQLGRGPAGVLVVEGETDHRFAADLVLAYKDWVLGSDGDFGELTSHRAVARAGSYGTLHTVNGLALPSYDVAAGADIRLRFVNLDNTRVVHRRSPAQTPS